MTGEHLSSLSSENKETRSQLNFLQLGVTDSQFPPFHHLFNIYGLTTIFVKERTQENRFGDNTWEYLGCVNHYRNAISTMLQNVPKDPCLKRQESVKRRIYQYVKKTESLIKKEEEESTSCNSSSMPYLRLFGDLADLRSGQKLNFYQSAFCK